MFKKGIGIFAFLFLCLFLACPILAMAAPYSPKTDEKPYVVVIDPGHGGENEGTIENGFQEKSMTMKVARAMYDELSQYENLEVYLTHDADIDMSLKERAIYAESVNADFLFSLHFNASLSHQIFGSEVWVSLVPDYNAWGYEFGYIHQRLMQDMGLFSRGIKTRKNDEGTDYYGIIRESVSRNIPAVIIEHCHVDEYKDSVFCDDDDKLIALGKADAQAVAAYFELTKKNGEASIISKQSMVPDRVYKTSLLKETFFDETPPDICELEVLSESPDTCKMNLQISAADYDTPLIYYSYSIDDGETFSELYPWPGSDTLDGKYQDTFPLDITIPEDTIPQIVVRAYNLFDAITESNHFKSNDLYRYPTIEETAIDDDMPVQSVDVITVEKPHKSSFFTFKDEESGPPETSILVFLKICFLLVFFLFCIFFLSQIIYVSRKRKKRKAKRKQTQRTRAASYKHPMDNNKR